MKFSTLAVLVLALIVAPMISQTLRAQPSSTRLSPNELVADLYKQHDRKRGPFSPGHSALVYKYFEKGLADMIRKDEITSARKHEVGVIDSDPLYDAQDMDIKHFAIGKPTFDNGKARVNVSFENLGDKKTLVFLLTNGRSGWRISDIDYGSGRTLLGEFKATP
jgi:Protein of unknown function (DUF3828)